MKVYRNKDGKKRLSRRGWLTIGISAAFATAAVAIILAISLTGTPVVAPPPYEPPPPPPPVAFVMPVDTVEIGKEFSNERLVRFKTTGFWETHEGVDFLAPAGTNVKAISAGTVLSIDVDSTMYGTVIRIQHADNIVSVYKGLARDVSVEVGDTVTAGKVIGRIGVMPIESMEYDTPHLHLEILRNGVRVNPIEFLPELGDK